MFLTHTNTFAFKAMSKRKNPSSPMVEEYVKKTKNQQYCLFVYNVSFEKNANNETICESIKSACPTNPTSVKRLSDGSFLLHFDSENDLHAAKNHAWDDYYVGDIIVTCPNQKMQPAFLCANRIDSSYELHEIATALTANNIEHKKLYRHVNNYGQESTLVLIELNSKDDLHLYHNSTFNIGAKKIKIQIYTPVSFFILRCNKCQKFGHRTSQCKAKESTCATCGTSNCNGECRKTFSNRFCVNCKGKHSAAWKGCKFFKEHFQLTKTNLIKSFEAKTTQKINKTCNDLEIQIKKQEKCTVTPMELSLILFEIITNIEEIKNFENKLIMTKIVDNINYHSQAQDLIVGDCFKALKDKLLLAIDNDHVI